MIFLFHLIFAIQVHAQAPGCISVEGIKMPCFGGGASCTSCDRLYTDDQMNNACRGTLPLTNPPGCPQGLDCGRKCCLTCSQFNPADFFTCQALPNACDASGNPIACGFGTKVATCSDQVCASQIPTRCGPFQCSCGVICQGTKNTKTCYRWNKRTVASGSFCGCRSSGGTPGTCSGVPTGASECGGVPSSCTSTSQTICLAFSNRCWSCTYNAGSPGACSRFCTVGSTECYENPVPVEMCVDTCPGEMTDNPVTPPGRACNTVPAPACTSDADCPACPPTCS